MRVDTAPITRAFKELRRKGYFAKQRWWCCQTCGVAAVPDEHADSYVFFHEGDFEGLKETGGCFLCWSGDAKLICDLLKEAGVKVDHNGSLKKRIYITLPGSMVN